MFTFKVCSPDHDTKNQHKQVFTTVLSVVSHIWHLSIHKRNDSLSSIYL